jgi:hypothetical protein
MWIIFQVSTESGLPDQVVSMIVLDPTDGLTPYDHYTCATNKSATIVHNWHEYGHNQMATSECPRQNAHVRMPMSECPCQNANTNKLTKAM